MRLKSPKVESLINADIQKLENELTEKFIRFLGKNPEFMAAKLTALTTAIITAEAAVLVSTTPIQAQQVDVFVAATTKQFKHTLNSMIASREEFRKAAGE